MNIRSMISNIFGNIKPKYKTINTFKLLNNSDSSFYSWNGRLYDNNVIRSAIGTNGINAAKLNPKHIRIFENEIKNEPNKNLKRILKTPNKYMTMFDFLQKMMIQREINNNAFAYIDRDPNIPGMDGIMGIYPLEFSSLDLLEDENSNLFIRFRFRNGDSKIASYEDIIHIRKHFSEHDFYGESNEKALRPQLEVTNATSQGITNAIKNTAFIRGILEFKNVLNPADRDKQIEDFSERYLNITKNNKGLAYTDPRYQFHETKAEPFVPNKAQMDYTKQEIYEYFNTNEKIIKGNFTDEEWIAYFETTIEPFALQMSQEMTRKIFTRTERNYGNEIICEANRLANASNATKITICEKLGHLFTINEQREIWNRGPVEGGDRRLQSLNYVNADKADEYQLKEKDGEKEGEKSNE